MPSSFEVLIPSPFSHFPCVCVSAALVSIAPVAFLLLPSFPSLFVIYHPFSVFFRTIPFTHTQSSRNKEAKKEGEEGGKESEEGGEERPKEKRSRPRSKGGLSSMLTLPLSSSLPYPLSLCVAFFPPWFGPLFSPHSLSLFVRAQAASQSASPLFSSPFFLPPLLSCAKAL